MMSVIFGVVEEGTLSIEFGKIHPYFRCGQSKTTVAATGDFIQEVLGIFEEYISRLRLALNDKLWTKNVKGNTYVYENLKSNKVIVNPPQGAFYLMPEFKNKKFKTSSKLCEVILNETGVAMLPGSDFGFKPKKMLARLSYTDFDGIKFFENVKNYNSISEEMVKTYAPNVVEGTTKLSNWAKNL